MPDGSGSEPEVVHHFKNYLMVIVSYSDLLLGELPDDHPQRDDIVEIDRAARAAIALLPDLAKHIR